MTDLALPFALAVFAALAGYAGGVAHVRSLRRVTALLLEGRLSAVALQLARFAALGAFLFICALAGPPVLICGAAGILVGRARTLRREGA